MATTIQLLRSDIGQQRPDPGVLTNGVPMVNLNEREPGLFFAARDGSLIKIGPVAVGEFAPNSSPEGEIGNSKGELWYDQSATSLELKVFDGNDWRPASPGLSRDTRPANTVFAAPSTGEGQPTFRLLAAADIPALDSSTISYSYNQTLGTREVGERLRDVVSVKDFGAVGNGVDDDTVYIDNALAESDCLLFPSGVYPYIGTNLDKILSGKSFGNGSILYGGVTYPVQRISSPNHLWAGEFFSWPMGTSFNISTAQRIHVPAGVTVARQNFQGDATVYQSPGPDGGFAISVARTAGTGSELPATIVLNLSEDETRGLRGKKCCLQFNAKLSSTYTGGATINYRVQYSPEAEQPITRSDGNYSSGSSTIIFGSIAPGTSFRNSLTPFFADFTVPSNATQIAVVFTAPFAGTAPANDSFSLASVRITEGSGPALLREEPSSSLIEKARTRYQTSYPINVNRGAATDQGAVQAVASVSQSPWGFAAQVSFSPRMALPPQVTFNAPGSGVEFRWLNKNTDSFISGMAYDVSDSGVTLTNNASVTVGHRYVCHWTAQAIL